MIQLCSQIKMDPILERDYFKVYLRFGFTVQNVFSTEKNKKAENNIGSVCTQQHTTNGLFYSLHKTYFLIKYIFAPVISDFYLINGVESVLLLLPEQYYKQASALLLKYRR